LKFNKTKLSVITIATFVAIQLIPTPNLNISSENPNDLFLNETVPESVSTLLKNSCYDCHSQETTLPWYQEVAPVKWLVNGHILEAREHLNFSEWNTLSKAEKAEALDDISDVVSEEEMPLKSYTLLHNEAKLTPKDRDVIVNWAEDLTESLFE